MTDRLAVALEWAATLASGLKPRRSHSALVQADIDLVDAIFRSRRSRAQVRHQNRRGLKLQSSGEFTREEWLHLVESYSGRCAYCGAQEPMTVDHVIPLSKGGSNGIENILPACRPCNTSKGTKSVEEFIMGRRESGELVRAHTSPVCSPDKHVKNNGLILNATDFAAG